MKVLPVDPSNMTCGDTLGLVLLESDYPHINISGVKLCTTCEDTDCGDCRNNDCDCGNH